MTLQTWEEFLPTLIRAREDAGLTMRQLADDLGLVTSAISHWENGRRIPAQNNAERWAHRLGVTLPTHAAVWFRRAVRAKNGRPLHGTRNGYQWHRENNQMPACKPCLVAAARYRTAWLEGRRPGR
jgi:transcriptional regulator with XRE-family HTH domain